LQDDPRRTAPPQALPPPLACSVMRRICTFQPPPHVVLQVVQSPHSDRTQSTRCCFWQGLVSFQGPLHCLPPPLGTCLMSRERKLCCTSSPYPWQLLHALHGPHLQSLLFWMHSSGMHSFPAAVSTLGPVHGLPHSLLVWLIDLRREHSPTQPCSTDQSLQLVKVQSRGSQMSQSGIPLQMIHCFSLPVQVATAWSVDSETFFKGQPTPWCSQHQDCWSPFHLHGSVPLQLYGSVVVEVTVVEDVCVEDVCVVDVAEDVRLSDVRVTVMVVVVVWLVIVAVLFRVTVMVVVAVLFRVTDWASVPAASVVSSAASVVVP